MQVVDAVVSFWKRNDVVHQVRRSDLTTLGAVAAQWLGCQDSVANPTPPLVVSTLSRMRSIIWQSVSHPPAALTKRTAAHLGDILSPSHSSKLPITAKGVAASRPPSTGMITPEIQRDSSLAK